MTTIPDRAEFTSTANWLERVADETGSEFDVLEAVVSELKPGLVSLLPDSRKRRRLQRLLKRHADHMTAVEGDDEAWIDLYFERDGEVDRYYQYTMLNHNLARATEEEAEILKLIAKEEEMDVTEGENYVMATQLDWEGVEEELRLLAKILDEVYGVAIEDIERAVERRGGESIAWTEV